MTKRLQSRFVSAPAAAQCRRGPFIPVALRPSKVLCVTAQTVIAVEDDKVLRFLQILLDPQTPAERMSVFADYVAHDIDQERWLADVHARVPGVFPATVRLLKDRADLLADAVAAEQDAIATPPPVSESPRPPSTMRSMTVSASASSPPSSPSPTSAGSFWKPIPACRIRSRPCATCTCPPISRATRCAKISRCSPAS